MDQPGQSQRTPDALIALYQRRGTSEQYHSEFKTDLDLERLPSGKFDTNALVLALAALAYNILRYIGQDTLIGAMSCASVAVIRVTRRWRAATRTSSASDRPRRPILSAPDSRCRGKTMPADGHHHPQAP